MTPRKQNVKRKNQDGLNLPSSAAQRTKSSTRRSDHPGRDTKRSRYIDLQAIALDEAQTEVADKDPAYQALPCEANRSTVNGPEANIIKIPGQNTRDLPSVPDSSHQPPEALQYRSLINIRRGNDPEQQNGYWTMVRFDTQASNSLMFESEARKLDLAIEYLPMLGSYKGLCNIPIACIGQVHIYFTFKGRTDNVYKAYVDVLADNPNVGKKTPFNILLGRDILNQHELVTINRAKVPHAFYAQRALCA